jgi:peptide/nickel transport system substrate-binding protein
MKTKKLLIVLILLTLFWGGCGKESSDKSNRVIIGISEDIGTFNPCFALSVTEGYVINLLYPGLVETNWDEKNGSVKISPLLSKKWEWNSDSTSLTFYLRDDVQWSDGIKFTADDVIFTFDVYSDPEVQSRFYGTFKDFYVDENNHINIKKTFEEKSPYKLIVHFNPNTNPKIFDVILPIIPKHIYDKIERKSLSTSEQSATADHPVSDGAFILDKWNRNQSIIFKSNPKSFLYKPENVKELIFKVIPDYTSRLTQLEKGDIDLMELIKPDDVPDLQKKNNLKIVPAKGREYEYVGWNNIDPKIFTTSKKAVSNKFFGDKNIRIALTYAINRREILNTYLGHYGQLAVGPISPIFKSIIDTAVHPYRYNPAKAEKLLKEAGWKDTNNNGILDKNGTEFSFSLYIPGGNPLRNYAATIIKNNLKAIGINVNIETIELGTLLGKVSSKSLDAWILAWYIPIPIDLKPFWYSDFDATPLNFVSYQNKNIDKFIDEIDMTKSQSRLKNLYYSFERQIHDDQPVTFLYWKDNIVAYNKKIRNIDINPLGVVHYCWNWNIKK